MVKIAAIAATLAIIIAGLWLLAGRQSNTPNSGSQTAHTSVGTRRGSGKPVPADKAITR